MIQFKIPDVETSQLQRWKFVETTKGGFMSRALFVKQFSSDLCKSTEEEKGMCTLNDKHVIKNTVVVGRNVMLFGSFQSKINIDHNRVDNDQLMIETQSLSCRLLGDERPKLLKIWVCILFNLSSQTCMDIQLLESPIPPAAAPAPRPSFTKSVTWRYLGNQAWYHRSAGVKTTGNNSE